MQSSSTGENVITDLRSILEEALERIKTEIFGAGHSPDTGAPADAAAAAADAASSDAAASAADSPRQD